jgi:hypothetical protein
MLAPILIFTATAFVAYLAIGFTLWQSVKLTLAVAATLACGWLILVLGCALG